MANIYFVRRKTVTEITICNRSVWPPRKENAQSQMDKWKEDSNTTLQSDLGLFNGFGLLLYASIIRFRN